MKIYTIFRECNDWEGETWNFYIPTEGNESEIAKLALAIKNSPEYSLEGSIDESDVDVLVKHDEGGYMAFHNKLSGKLSIGTLHITVDDDPLYKGGIKEFIK